MLLQVGTEIQDLYNGCRSVKCEKGDDGKITKVEKTFECNEDCPLGWVYEMSPMYPQVCCGSCTQVGSYINKLSSVFPSIYHAL